MDKKTLRRKLKGRLNALSAEEIKRKNGLICEHFVNSGHFERAGVLMAYLAMDREADPAEIIRHALRTGKRIVVPKVISLEEGMIAVEIDSLETGIAKGAYGICEPVSDDAAQVSEIDVIIVPGLGFDDFGGRLGRGGGFYDRFLGIKGMRAELIGCGFAEQVVESVPVEEHDRRVDYVLTDEGITDCKRVHGG